MVCLQLSVFLLMFASASACIEQPWPTFHYWREPTPGNNRYIRTTATGLSYEIYNGNDDDFWYVTKFYDCGSQAYISTKAVASSSYVGNDNTGNGADLIGPTGFGTTNDPLLFQYGGDSFMDSVTMLSRNGEPRYISGVGFNSIKLKKRMFWWWSIPYVTSGLAAGAEKALTISGSTTTLVSSIQIGASVVQVAVNVDTSTTPNQLRVETLTQSTSAFQFNMIKYRIYTKRRYGGRVAIVLRSNLQDYLAVDITADGIARTPQIHTPSGLKYSVARLVSYNDAARSRNSTFIKADVALQTAIDQRFFEVTQLSDGKATIRSMVDRDLFLAVAQFSSGQPELVMAPMQRFLPTSLISYDFELSDTDPPATVRRPPTFRRNIKGRRPMNMRRGGD